MISNKKYILQLCHNYKMPFLDVARQYASLFVNTDYHLITVYLTGVENTQVIQQSLSEKVIFLNNQSKDLRGLKLKQIKQLKHICSQYDFDFAIAHRYKSIYILCHIKLLSVIGVHHAFGDYNRFMRRWFITRHKHQVKLLAVSNAVRDEIRSKLAGFPTEKIQTLYNRINIKGVETKQCSRLESRQKLGIDKNKFIFANVGRLHPDKDQKTLIDAFALVANKLPDALLIIIGKGRLEPDLKKQVKQLNLHQQVLFLGVIADVVNYFKAFDCFVLSSDHEPFGMVLLEAIVAKIPVLSTDAGGAREIVKAKSSLFAVGDSNKLAALMLQRYSVVAETTGADSIKCEINNNFTFLNQNFTDKVVKEQFWKLLLEN